MPRYWSKWAHIGSALQCRAEQGIKSDVARTLLLQVLTADQAAQLLIGLFPLQCDTVMLLHSLLRAPCIAS